MAVNVIRLVPIASGIVVFHDVVPVACAPANTFELQFTATTPTLSNAVPVKVNSLADVAMLNADG